MQDLMKKAQKMSYDGQMETAEELMGQEASTNKSKVKEEDDGISYMFTLMVFGSIGTGYFLYGKKASKFVFLFSGIALCVFPIFIASATINIILGVICIILPFKIQG